jgi:hypothetical protein
MTLNKILEATALAVLALMAFGSSASATTLETNGVTQSGAVTIDWSLSGSTTWETTSNEFVNTCTSGTWAWTTNIFTGTVSGPVSTLSSTNCTHEKVVVDAKGSLSVERIGATTNGTVRSSGAEMTVPATIGSSIITVNCKTNNTDIGTLTGTASGTSTVDVNAVLNCGFFVPSMKWTGHLIGTGFPIGVGS